jgi:hypothetical protein
MLESDIGGKNFDYVAVEVIENPGLRVTQIESGLFMGILTHSSGSTKESHFIALQTGDSAVRLYNLKEFNILTVEALSVNMNYMTVFKNSKDDQNEAFGILRAVVKEMAAHNRLFDTTPNCELIDVDSYVNVPAHILVNDTLSGTTGTSYNRPTTTTTKYGNDYQPYVYKEPEKPKVLNFKRKGKLPAPEKLENMRKMVQALTAGKTGVVIGKLPVPKCDVIESPPKEEASSTSV